MSDESTRFVIPEGLLFQDMEDPDSGWQFSEDDSDRKLLFAIWNGHEIGDLPVQEGWRILWERYPEDLRFLAALVSEEIHAVDMGSPEQVCGKLEKILEGAKGRLDAEVRDLLAFARLDFDDDRATDVRREKPLSAATAKRVASLRARVGHQNEGAGGEAGPVARLAAFRRTLIRSLHDQTMGGKPIRPRAARQPDSWREMVAAAPTKRRYAPDMAFASGDAVEHPKFGVGVVTAVHEGRATILFETGERKLVTAPP